MAFGSNPHFDISISFPNYTRTQLLSLCIKVSQQLQWQVSYANTNGVKALTNNGMYEWNAQVSIAFTDDGMQINSKSASNEFWDLGKNKKNCHLIEQTFAAEQAKYSLAELDHYYGIISDQLTPLTTAFDTTTTYTAEKPTTDDSSFFSVFIPRKGYWVTPILIHINLLVFILMGISGVGIFEPDSESLIKWGANYTLLTLQNQVWRLFTCVFIHIGIFHIAMNMYALLNIGVMLERLIGSTRFLVAYLLCGIGASMASLWWHDVTVSAGASGAIFGMYGVFLALLTSNLIEKQTRTTLLSSILLFVVFNLTVGTAGNIDNAAHIGGLLSGLLLGYYFVIDFKSHGTTALKYSILFVVAVLFLTGNYFWYKSIPNDLASYQTTMNELIQLETKANSYYRLPDNANNEQRRIALQDSGIVSWEKAIASLNKMEAMKLPPKLKQRSSRLITYCKYRKQTLYFIQESLQSNSIALNDSIARYNKKCEALIQELNHD